MTFPPPHSAPSPVPPAPQGRMTILGAHDEAAWLEVLEEVQGYDFCHLPQYHRVAEKAGEGLARLFVWRESGHTLAFPLLLRPIHPDQPEGWKDATSVYGYGGPLASAKELPGEVIQHFQGALHSAFQELKIVSAFSRLHPLLPQHALLEGLGKFRSLGQTVSIDLTQPEEVQWAGYHKKCRSNIRKLQESGFVGVHDQEMRYFREFVDIYHETMGRVSAYSHYFFDHDYFQTLARELGSALHLFVVLFEGKVAAASLATFSDGIMQDFLGGTRDAFLKMSPDRLTVDTERRCACQMGAKVLHLGGGVGSQEDSVFKFKTRFSDRRHTFSTWQGVFLPEVYADLIAKRAEMNTAQNLQAISPDYFPAYRCPTLPT